MSKSRTPEEVLTNPVLARYHAMHCRGNVLLLTTSEVSSDMIRELHDNLAVEHIVIVSADGLYGGAVTAADPAKTTLIRKDPMLLTLEDIEGMQIDTLYVDIWPKRDLPASGVVETLIDLNAIFRPTTLIWFTGMELEIATYLFSLGMSFEEIETPGALDIYRLQHGLFTGVRLTSFMKRCAGVMTNYVTACRERRTSRVG